MMEKGLVSIITPCYNTATIVHRLLDSILSQDYQSLEVIAVDDGSTDMTLSVLNDYRKPFEDRHIAYTILHEENSGQSVAINKALKQVKGEFLLWPDSDDFYNRSDAVSLIVKTFRQLPGDFGMIKMLPRYVNSDLIDITGNYVIDKSERQFEQALFDNHFIWGFYAIAVHALDAVNPQREIYTEKKAGQNWQLVLPVLYSYKCYTLEENVFSVLSRRNSHSRPSDRGLSPQLERIEVYERTILHTLDRIREMPPSERERYKKDIRLKYARQKLYVSSFFADKNKARTYIKDIIHNGGHLSLKEFVRDILLRMNLYPFSKR